MLKIEILVRVADNGQIEAAKVRKLITGEDGLVRRYGLNLETGEWVLVPESHAYPAECLQIFPEGVAKVVDIPIE